MTKNKSQKFWMVARCAPGSEVDVYPTQHETQEAAEAIVSTQLPAIGGTFYIMEAIIKTAPKPDKKFLTTLGDPDE